MLYSDLEVSRLLVRERHEQLKRDAARRTVMRAAWRSGTVRLRRSRAFERRTSVASTRVSEPGA